MAQRIAIVGAAASDHGRLQDTVALQLHVQAAQRALADAGLKKDDVDGLFSAATGHGMMPLIALSEYMGLAPRHMDGTNTGGGAWELLVDHAAAALELGLCDVALVVFAMCPLGEGSLGTGVRFSLPGTPVAYDDPFGMPLPARAALAANRHMHEFGTTSEQMAEVAVATRRNASFNPNAMHRTPITIDDVLESKMIADPLHKLDCCIVSDGGGALVMVREERVKDLDREPVWVLGSGHAVASESIAGWTDLPRMAAYDSARRAYERAGVTAADMDLRMLYDAFTINVILQLEALGFCEEGEGGPLVEGGALAFDGALPTNTDGGGLSSNHPGMRGIFLLIEAVRQLRHEAGEVQVPDAELAICNGTGGPFCGSSTVILGRDR